LPYLYALDPGMLQGQFWQLLDSLKIVNFGYFLQVKVSTFGNFLKHVSKSSKTIGLLKICQFWQFWKLFEKKLPILIASKFAV